MAFVEITKLRPSFYGHNIPPIVTMGAYLADGKKHTSKSIIFRMTNALVEQLGWTFDADDSLYVKVHEGNGPDAGFLQIVPSEPSVGARKITRSKEASKRQGISVSISVDSMKHYVLNECPVAAAEQVFTVDGDVLIIQCPDWLRYNPQSYKEPEVKKPTTPRPPTLEVVGDDDVHLNREQRRRLAKRVAGSLR